MLTLSGTPDFTHSLYHYIIYTFMNLSVYGICLRINDCFVFLDLCGGFVADIFYYVTWLIIFPTLDNICKICLIGQRMHYIPWYLTYCKMCDRTTSHLLPIFLVIWHIMTYVWYDEIKYLAVWHNNMLIKHITNDCILPVTCHSTTG